MCGIVGLFAKHPAVEERLGAHLGAMLTQMANRGPDSAGIAIYREGHMEIIKEVGDPRRFVERFGLASMSGTHGLGHTRMATESKVTTEGAHPFSTGQDLCLVHNGSLSNHNALRRKLRHEGIAFRTENDTEVAAGYLEWRLREGDTLQGALEGCLVDLDGFYTFAGGTPHGF